MVNIRRPGALECFTEFRAVFSTAPPTTEPMTEPMQRMLQAANGQEHRIVGREMGQLWTPDHTIQVTAEGVVKDV